MGLVAKFNLCILDTLPKNKFPPTTSPKPSTCTPTRLWSHWYRLTDVPHTTPTPQHTQTQTQTDTIGRQPPAPQPGCGPTAYLPGILMFFPEFPTGTKTMLFANRCKSAGPVCKMGVPAGNNTLRQAESHICLLDFKHAQLDHTPVGFPFSRGAVLTHQTGRSAKALCLDACRNSDCAPFQSPLTILLSTKKCFGNVYIHLPSRRARIDSSQVSRLDPLNTK